MSFKIIHNQTPKEKERRRIEYTAWLEEHGYAPQSQPSDKPLLQARSLTQELIKDLQSIDHDTQAALRLATNIEEILNTIK
jgi:hypothetical protein